MGLTMATEHRRDDWDSYRMEYRDPHRELEPLAQEVEVVAETLAALNEAGVLPGTDYCHDKFLAHREAVRDHFEIPWTAITPRMQRLLYAINAIRKPTTLLAAGIFCGNTFISNAGAAIGPGACYQAKRLIGVEIVDEKAALARRNVAKIDPAGEARIITDDAVAVAAGLDGTIDLLYLDADGDRERGKGIYLDILEACYDKLSPGALVVAHNSVNCAERLKHYLAFVRDPAKMRHSINVIFDIEGLEVSVL